MGEWAELARLRTWPSCQWFGGLRISSGCSSPIRCISSNSRLASAPRAIRWAIWLNDVKYQNASLWIIFYVHEQCASLLLLLLLLLLLFIEIYFLFTINSNNILPKNDRINIPSRQQFLNAHLTSFIPKRTSFTLPGKFRLTSLVMFSKSFATLLTFMWSRDLIIQNFLHWLIICRIYKRGGSARWRTQIASTPTYCQHGSLDMPIRSSIWSLVLLTSVIEAICKYTSMGWESGEIWLTQSVLVSEAGSECDFVCLFDSLSVCQLRAYLCTPGTCSCRFGCK